MGDPAGIGPEIIAKSWKTLKDTGPLFAVVGDHDSMAAAVGGREHVKRISSLDQAAAHFRNAIPVLDMPLKAQVVAGQPSSSYASAVISWIESAVGQVLSGSASAIVTGPIAKAPLYEAGFRFPGHTEFLAELTLRVDHPAPRGPVMMLAAGDLKTVLVTIHEPISAVPSLLTIERIAETALITARALQKDFGIENPRLVMAGLNPHAGEGGGIGTEDAAIIAPACRALNERGIQCSGPRPADTLFHEDARKTYDAAICMYHDQALIPVKMLDFWGGVNVTLGLPIVRTSPDHGVAFDVAGRGIARPDSMIAALRMADDIARRRAT